MKECLRCHQTKPRAQFAGRWGNSPHCQECYQEWRREDDRERHNRPESRERMKDRHRERYQTDPEFAAERLEKSRRYRAEHPERKRYRTAAQRKARWTVSNALTSGRLTKGVCQICGSQNVHAHHHNGYDDVHLLDVVWLCPLHHKEAHRVLVDNVIN